MPKTHSPYLIIRNDMGTTYRILLSAYSALKDIEIKHIDVWYNRQERSWVVQLKDAEDCQVDSSDYVYTRDEADHLVGFYIRDLLARAKNAARVA
jgi:hypothetical protein